MSLAKTIKNIKKGQRGIITPTVEQWLATKGYTLGFGTDESYELLVTLAKASQGNSIRHGRFGASARGTCERKQVYKFLGMPVPYGSIDPQLQNIFNDGTVRHIRWQIMGMAAGIFTDVEVPYSIPAWRLSISMDAINVNGMPHSQYPDEPFIFELKGTSANIGKMKTVEDMPLSHVLQMHTYFFATGWDFGIYVAEDKRTQNWQEILVPKDEKMIREVKSELNRLNDAIDTEAIPPIQEECRRKRGFEYRNCEFKGACLNHHTQDDPWPEIDPRTNRVEAWPSDVGTSVQIGRRVRNP